ncbi:Patatin-like phosphoLipase [Phytophthora palmivora]|uniref:Patatin-like phosphoLipase n=1 Tax=Phytophthora palmivora TaxID=4796 RepID=A0A2P4YGQ7_9STRA|nr:Patatin-like phosphoLipase [Phytophthora palmivora]
MSFSFACGGYLKMYLFGVAKALQQFELEKNARLIGCSAGALTATGLALNCNFDAIRDFLMETRRRNRSESW